MANEGEAFEALTPDERQYVLTGGIDTSDPGPVITTLEGVHKSLQASADEQAQRMQEVLKVNEEFAKFPPFTDEESQWGKVLAMQDLKDALSAHQGKVLQNLPHNLISALLYLGVTDAKAIVNPGLIERISETTLHDIMVVPATILPSYVTELQRKDRLGMVSLALSQGNRSKPTLGKKLIELQTDRYGKGAGEAALVYQQAARDMVGEIVSGTSQSRPATAQPAVAPRNRWEPKVGSVVTSSVAKPDGKL